ncbi:hypothetical protein [Streptosporangium sandarakinum]|uniref:hypothetical protein n=1 Tax=Streptosporangium sandarakinum TaxID=1260955 RepID=UPI003678F3E3
MIGLDQRDDLTHGRLSGSQPGHVLQAGHNGKLTSDHHYISAVALLRERPHSAAWATAWFDENRPRFGRIQDMIAAYLQVAETDSVPQGSEVFLTVIETIGEEAVRLPRDLFNGPLDLRYGSAPDGTGLTLLSVRDLP